MQRAGLGYDSHRFAPGRILTLGGVTISNEHGLAGHSDADVVLHAVTDAILGAIGEGDIGEHFPDTDPALKGANSAIFLRRAIELASKAGFKVGNCDVTVLAQFPKLTPFKPAMRKSLAGLMGLPESAVAVKAKTNEGMGFVGRGEGIAVLAIVMMEEA